MWPVNHGQLLEEHRCQEQLLNHSCLLPPGLDSRGGRAALLPAETWRLNSFSQDPWRLITHAKGEAALMQRTRATTRLVSGTYSGQSLFDNPAPITCSLAGAG